MASKTAREHSKRAPCRPRERPPKRLPTVSDGPGAHQDCRRWACDGPRRPKRPPRGPPGRPEKDTIIDFQ
eukprot:6460550-Pyramimonas_sp.AAC.1